MKVIAGKDLGKNTKVGDKLESVYGVAKKVTIRPIARIPRSVFVARNLVT